MLVRLPLESEEDAVIDLVRMDAAETVPHLPFSEDRARATFRRYLETANPTVFVVEDNREIVGFLTAYLTDYTFADGFYVAQDVIYVRPDKRGTRAAAHLVKTLRDWGFGLGATEVFAGIANGYKSNKLTPERTARFMGHFGFQPVGQLLRMIRTSDGKEGR